MAKSKVTITLDREQVAEVMRLTGALNTSSAIDLALRSLIKSARVASDVAAYIRHPTTESERALASLPRNWADLADDVDWDASFPVNNGIDSKSTDVA